jgi:hypothetical protein
MGGLKKFLRGDLQKFAVPKSNTPLPSQAYDSTRTTVVCLDGATTSVMEGQASSSPPPPYTFDVGMGDLLSDVGPDEGLLNEEPPVSSDDPCEPRCPNQVCHNRRSCRVKLICWSENRHYNRNPGMSPSMGGSSNGEA